MMRIRLINLSYKMILVNYESNRANNLGIISYNKDPIKLTQKKLKLKQKIFNSILYKYTKIILILLFILCTFSLFIIIRVFLTNNIDLEL